MLYVYTTMEIYDKLLQQTKCVYTNKTHTDVIPKPMP